MPTMGGAAAVAAWYHATEELATVLAAIFEACMPEEFAKLRKAFEAGKWFVGDPGPWIGRTIVYKLQLYAHFDPSEAGPTISFPAGYFRGGHFQVPRLGCQFMCVLTPAPFLRSLTLPRRFHSLH